MEIKCQYVKLVDLEALTPHTRNTNKHPQKQIDVLARIIKNRGMRHPIIVSNRSGFIVAGHGRLEALKILGVEKAPVDFQDFENEADEVFFLESDNHIAEFAEHDKSKMIQNLKDIEINLEEFDFEELGLIDFEVPQLVDENIFNGANTTDNTYVEVKFLLEEGQGLEEVLKFFEDCRTAQDRGNKLYETIQKLSVGN